MIATGAEMLRWQAVTTVFAGIVLLLTVLFQATGKVIPALHPVHQPPGCGLRCRNAGLRQALRLSGRIDGPSRSRCGQRGHYHCAVGGL